MRLDFCLFLWGWEWEKKRNFFGFGKFEVSIPHPGANVATFVELFEFRLRKEVYSGVINWEVVNIYMVFKTMRLDETTKREIMD